MIPAAAGLAGFVVFGLDLFGESAPPAPVETAAPATTGSVTAAAPRPERTAPATGTAAPVTPAAAPAPSPRPDARAALSPAQPAEDSRSAAAPPVPARVEPPPAPQPPPFKLSAEEIAAHLMRGEERLKRGEVAAARLYFERVALAGDRRGAHGMARTYDPAVLASLPVLGRHADPAAARLWYQRAERQSAAR
jgi:hypothetical protein